MPFSGRSSITRASEPTEPASAHRPVRAARTVATAAVAAVLWLGLGSESTGQPAGIDPLSGRDVADGVYVRDSAIAVDRLALAERLEGLGDWSKAADVYQEVVAEFGDRLVAEKVTPQGEVYQYGTVADAVQRRLATWPAQGQRVYEQRFGPLARDLLARAQEKVPADADLLGQVVSRYFITTAGRDAGLLLVDQHLAEGRFAAARRMAGRLLDTHPALGDAEPKLLLRAAAAAHLHGDSEAASRLAEQLDAQFPEARATVAGEHQVLADVARELLETPAPAPTWGHPATWPTLAGDVSRNRLASPIGSQIAAYFTVELQTTTPRGSEQYATAANYEMSRRTGQMTGIFPVAHEEALYWTDNLRVYAVALESGLPLPGWLATHGRGSRTDVEGAYQLPGNGWTTPRGAALAPVVTDRHVFALLGVRDEQFYVNEPSVSPPMLVCLDRRTGVELWRRSVPMLARGQDHLADDLEDIRFVASPMVVGDAVWMLAKTDPARNRQFEQSFVLSIDIATGSLRTATYLTTASRDGDFRRHVQQTAMPDPNTPLSYADGLVYAATDRGAIAAIRASDGAVEWLNLYPRNQLDMAQRRFGAGLPRRTTLDRQTQGQPFHVSPLIVDSGRLFIRPPDASQIFVYDATDGRELTRIDLDLLENQRTLLGVIDNRLITFGPHHVQCIDWQAYSPDADLFEWTLWISEINAGVRGRPAITGDQVLVPSANNIVRIDLEEARIVDTYPPGGATWEEGEEPGNVVVLEDHLVIAGPTRLNVLADSEVIRRKLEARLEEAPHDPMPLLRLAQLAFVRGSFAEVGDHLRTADELIERLPRSQRPEAREALFTITLSFASSLHQRVLSPLGARTNPEDVDRFFDWADEFARTPHQNVRARFARASFAQTAGGAAKQVAVLQEVLADPQWRRVPAVSAPGEVPGQPAISGPAGEIARQLISRFIEEQGRDVYEAVEREAGAALEEAQRGADQARISALLEVAAVYPNSRSASAALADAAGLLEEAGQHAEATATLRRLVQRDPGESLPHLLRLAALDLERGRVDIAAGRLRRAARIDPTAIVPEDAVGTNRRLAGLRVEQAAFELTEAAIAAGAARAVSFALPLEPTAAPFADDPILIEDVRGLLRGVEGFDRPDRMILRRGDGKLSIHRFGEPDPLVVMDAPPGELSAAWLEDDLLLWSEFEVLLVAPDGSTLWRHEAAGLVGDESVLAAAETPVVAGRLGAGNDAAQDAGDTPLAMLEQAIEELPGHVQVHIAQTTDALRESGERGRLHFEEDPAERRFVALDRADTELKVRANGEISATLDGVGMILSVRGVHPAAAAAGRLAGPAVDDDEAHAQPIAEGASRVMAVVPHDGTIAVAIAGTKGSVVIGLDRTGGSNRWSVPLPDGELSATSAGGDFASLRLDGAENSVLLSVDLDSGAIANRQEFERSGVNSLVQFLVSPDEELLVVTPRHVRGFDLLAGASRPRFQTGPSEGRNSLPFMPAALGEGAMSVVGDKLLVYADPRLSGRRDVIVIDLTNGRPQSTRDDEAGQSFDILLAGGESTPEEMDDDNLPPQARRAIERREALAQPGQRDRLPRRLPGERLWVNGSRVYLTAQRGLSAYDLARPAQQWRRLNTPLQRQLDPATIVDLAIGRDHVLLFDVPAIAPGRTVRPRTLRVTAFSRLELPDGRESGQPLFEVEFAPGQNGLDGAATAWQAGPGGLALLCESGKLLIIRPAG